MSSFRDIQNTMYLSRLIDEKRAENQMLSEHVAYLQSQVEQQNMIINEKQLESASLKAAFLEAMQEVLDERESLFNKYVEAAALVKAHEWVVNHVYQFAPEELKKHSPMYLKVYSDCVNNIACNKLSFARYGKYRFNEFTVACSPELRKY